MKRAFTLIELLVVVGILSILMGILVAFVGEAPETARATKCLTGLSSLAKGCLSRAQDQGYFPLAGSVERFGIDESQGIKNVKECYNELPGWISWYSNNAYRGKPTSHISSSSWFLSCYEQNIDKRLYCLTNGTLWKYVGQNADLYVCPGHVRAMPKDLKPAWSYVMNGRFHYDDTYGSGSKSQYFGGIKFSDLKRADRVLLFAEIPWAANDTEPDPQRSTAPGIDFDCTLHYKDRDREAIGFDHKDGDGRWVAHVAFADGHTEQIHQPREALTRDQAWRLTSLLCQGKDIDMTSKNYEELK